MDWLEPTLNSFLNILPTAVRTFLDERRQKKRLRQMLIDPRFPKGFRGTDKLMAAIGADRPATERLLLIIGARKSETSDEWTFNTPPTKRS